MQRGGLWKAAAGQCIDEVRSRVELLPQRLNVPRLRRAGDALHRLRFSAGADASALDVAREQLDGLMPAILGDLVNRPAVAIGSCRIEARCECTAHGVDVAGAGCLEHAIAVASGWIDRLDMRFEGAPALEAIVIGDRELRLMQLGIGLISAQLSKPLLSGLSEPVEIGVCGQSLRHGTPSFCAPGDRNSRA